MRTIQAGLTLLLLLALIACSEDPTKPTGPEPVASITVSPATFEVQAGSSSQLTAALRSATGDTLTGRAVTWSTADSAIARVSASGLVTGLRKGSTTVTASAEEASASASVTVVPGAVASLQLSLTDSVLVMLNPTTSSVAAYDSLGNEVTGVTVVFSSSDAEIATVDSAGRIEALYEGKVEIRATLDSITGVDTLDVLLNPDVWQAYWVEVPGAMPDLTDVYEAAWGGHGGVPARVAVLDVNRDGRDDLFVQMWSVEVGGSRTLYTREPISDRLVVLVSQPDGSFRNATTEVLGQPTQSLGFLGESAALDVNSDGYLDVVIPGVREDGRPCGSPDPLVINCSNWRAPNAIMMSNGDGTYRFEIFGDEQVRWTTPNLLESNGRRFLFMGGSSRRTVNENGGVFGTPEVYEIVGSSLTLAGTFPAGTDLFRTLDGGDGRYLIQGPYHHLDTPSIVVNRWSPDLPLVPIDTVDLFEGDPRQIAAFLGWNSYGVYQDVLIVSHQGYDIMNPRVALNCIIGAPGQEQSLVTMFDAPWVPGGYDGNGTVPNLSNSPFTSIRLFQLDGQRLRQAGEPAGLDPERGGTRLECRDVNGDGSQDIVVNVSQPAWSSSDPYRISPQLFIGGSGEVFSAVPPHRFPSTTDYNEGQSTVLMDTDGDGLPDLLQYPFASCDPSYMDCDQWRLWRARRPIR